MNLNSKKILITGGAGFIGSELVRQLAEEKVRVVVVDNLVNGRRENLEGLLNDRVELVVMDIRDSERMVGLLEVIDIIYHLACLGVRHSIHSPHENHEVNATATLGLLSAAQAGGVKRFVHVSSSEVYGTASRVPMGEDHPTFPMTVYGAAKLAGECYTRAFFRTYGYPTVVVRLFNTYGPHCHHEGDSGEVIPKFMLRCMAGCPMVIFGDGSQTRDFIYVSDAARGIFRVGLTDEAVGETINLGSGQEVTIKDLAEEVAGAVGKQEAEITYEQPRPGDTLRLYADITKARRIFGFEPALRLNQGLSKLRDWYLGCGQTPEKLLEEEVLHNWKIDGIKADTDDLPFSTL